jgi:hypothetical protein
MLATGNLQRQREGSATTRDSSCHSGGIQRTITRETPSKNSEGQNQTRGNKKG